MDQVNISISQEGGCSPSKPPPAGDINWAEVTGVNIKWSAVEENELDHTPDTVPIAIWGFAAAAGASEAMPRGVSFVL